MLREIDKKVLLLSPAYLKQKQYWIDKLSGNITRTELFPRYKTNDRPQNLLDKIEKLFPAGLFNRLAALGKHSHLSIYITLLAGIKSLIYRCTDNPDITVISPVNKKNGHNRGLNDFLLIRDEIHGDMSFKQVLLTVRQSVLEAHENRDFPLGNVLDHLAEGGENRGIKTFSSIGCGLETIHEPLDVEATGAALWFSFSREADRLKAVLRYDPGEYEKDSTPRLLDHLITLLEGCVQNIDIKISRILFLGDEEKKKLIHEFNRTGAGYPEGKTICRLFAEQVEKGPHRTALVFKDSQVTYSRLNLEANRLAGILQRKGVRPNRIVGVMMERSHEMVIAMLSILKAGGAYLPIDPDNPGKRVNFFLEDAGVPLLVTTSHVAGKHPHIYSGVIQSPGAKVFRTASRPHIKDLGSLPIPDRSLVDYEKYNRYIGLTLCKNSISLQATRGCPFKCAYCHKIWPKKHVYRSAGNIFDEVRLYYDMGVRRFAFVDDVFNLDEANGREFFQLLIDNQLKVQLFFPAGLRGDLLTRSYIDLMVRAGTVNIGVALETASSRLQKLIGKNLNLERLRENLEYLCREYPHVITELFIMHGFPTETEEEAVMTLDFVKSLEWIHFPYLHILKIYPNTDMEKIALENGISRRAIMDSVGLAYHQLPDTLPFDKSFTLKCQSDFFNQYFMSGERLLHVLLHQLQLLTEDEILQKYDSYLPVDIKSLQGLLEFFGLSGDELGEFAGVEEDFGRVPGLQEKMKRFFPVRVPAENALKVLLLDLSQFFKGENPMLYDVVEPPLGLMYLLTYLYQQFGNKVKGKIAKSRIDFNSFEELKALLGEFQPDVIGIRTLSFYKDFFHQAVSLMRHWGWSVPIIAGGPYATSDYMNIAQDPNIDLVVLGEGELTFSELIGKIMENGGVLPDEGILKEIPGIAVVPCKRHSHRCFEYDRGREIILMDEIPGHEHKQPAIEPRGNVTTVDKPGDLAYIIYTSGTTGNPKGVMIEHKNVVRLMINDKFPFDFSSSDVWTMFHSSSFDFSVWEMYGALLYGGKLIVIPEMVTVDFERYLQILKEEGVSVLNQTPSAFYNLAAVEMKYPGRELKLKYVIFGGEALSPVKLKKWKEIYPGTKLINMFGITETTVHVTYKEITDEDILLNRSNIGKPIPTLRTYVMDKNLELLPVGAAGELWVGGDGVGRGYLNRPGLTGERFIPDPFKPGETLYRSGDLVRLWENGEMEYIGRADHQVKIRGYRIELGEIEAQLLRHKEIIGAVIVSKEDKSGDKYLCAYFISESKIESAELRNHLSMHLPGYVIPSYFMQLDSIPLTVNGKIDLRRLPAPEVGADGDYRAPADKVEETLAEVWADVLNLKKEVISVDANFFELGGHSLKTAVLISKIFKELHVKVPFINVFETPTIRGLARYIRSAEKNTFESVEPVEKKEYYTASASQKRLYLLQQMKKNSTGYNVPQAVKLEGEPDISGLGSIFTEMIRRHDSLRTSFYMIGEQVVQKVHDNVDFQIEYINPGSPGNPAALVQEFICSFDLSKAPLLRVRLCRLEEFKHLLIVDMHHIITDGTSMGVFIKDVFALYRGDRLPNLRIQYKDFSEWQNKLFESGEIENQEKYWLKEFEKEIPVLNFPTDFPVPLTSSYEGDSIPFKLNARLVKELRQLALRENCTLYIVLLTIFNIFLFELSGQGDIIVGAPLAGRRHSDLDQVIGFFINLLPLRNFPSDDKTCKEFLNEVSKQALAAFDNQDYPFDDLVEKVTRQRIPGRNPLVDVVFWLQNFEIAGKQKEKKTSLAVTPYMYQYRAAKYHLMLGCWESRENLSLVFEYNTRLFKKERIRKMADDFIQLVEVIVGDINVPIGEFQLESRLSMEENPLTDLQFNI